MDGDEKMSKYQEVVEDIIHKIEKNEYTDKLPTEDQLIEQYQVSRNTIRNAIRTLKKQGTLFSIQGSGVFVRHTRDDDSLWMNGSCGITENAPRHKITTDVKGFHIMMAGEELSKRMQCELTTPIYYIERVRKMDGVPMAIEYTYYNKDLVPSLDRRIASQSIYSYIKNDLKLSIGFADKYFHVKQLSAQEASILGLEEGSPALEVEDYVHLSNGQLFNVSRIVYNYKTTNFYASNVD